MTAAPPRPQAVLFDAYGTLFDVYSVGVVAETLFPGQGAALGLLWRDKQIEYSRLHSMSGRYRPFWDITRAGLRFAAARLTLPLTGQAEEQLMQAYRQLLPFSENLQVLRTLQARGIRAGILSNGDAAMLLQSVRSAGFDGLLEPLLSAEAVRRFKTDPAVYDLGPAALSLAAADILLVSSNGWDAIGATWYGYTTLWVNRAGLPLEQLDTQPTRTGRSLDDVLSFFPTP